MCLSLAGACTGEIEREPGPLAVASAALSVADCPAGYNIIQGTFASNVLFGTAGNDCILGLGGNDTINGGGGTDFLIGGFGNDILRGGDGNDVLHGEQGTDRLEGQNDDDTLYGGTDDDTVLGGSGDDTLYGDDGDDSMDGNAGDDSLYGGDGRDELAGGDDDDRLFGEADGDWLYGDGGDDILDGGAGGDECWAGEGNDVVTGGDGSDLLVGDDGNDFLADDSATHFFTHGGSGTDACSGYSCELPEPALSGCTEASGCAASQTCVADVGMCLPCGTVGGVGCNSGDNCPSDPDKTEPGICGCGVADTDSDSDGTADCLDACPSDPAKVAAGTCGCGVSDADSDSDGVADCNDLCPGFDDAIDSDQDGTPDGCETNCPNGATVHVGDVTLTGTPTPAELAALAGVQCIAGSLTVSATTLTDLSAFGALEMVDGDLAIDDNDQLASVEGLHGLTRIVGFLTITGNAVLDDLNGLASLAVLNEAAAPGDEGFLIADNAQLASCWPDVIAGQTGKICQRSLTASDCIGNTGTGVCAWTPPPTECVPGTTGPGIYDGGIWVNAGFDVSQLEGITCVTGMLWIEFNAASDLSFLSSLQAVGGDLRITIMPFITSLDGLQALQFVRGALRIYGNYALQSLDGLSALRYVGGTIAIHENNYLESIDGLSALESVASVPSAEAALDIRYNAMLPQCDVDALAQHLGVECGDALNECVYNLGVGSCSQLPPGFVCESGATGPAVFDGDITIAAGTGGPIVSGMTSSGSVSFPNGMRDLIGIECITGVLQIESSSVGDLTELMMLSLIGSDLYIFDTALFNLYGLQSLTSIRGQLAIGGNSDLQTLAELSSLTTLGITDPFGFDLLINNNADLHACWVAELEAQTGTTCGGSPFICDGNLGSPANCGD